MRSKVIGIAESTAPLRCMPSGARRLRILLVDDDATARRAVGRTLRQHVVFEAACLAQAEDLMRSHTTDLVITDYEMPEGSGTAVLEIAEQLQRSAHRVMISGQAPMNLRGLLDRGLIHRFVPKPWQRELVDEVASLLSAQARRRR